MPSAEPWPAGLTTIGKSSRASMAGSAFAAPSSRNAVSRERVEVGRGDAGVAHRVLGEHLVHAADAGGRAGAGVGEADELEQLLHGAVLAAAAVQRDERDVGARRLEPLDEVGADVDARHLVAEPLERVLHLGAGAQRDVALERAAALEHGDPAHCARRRSGSTLGSAGSETGGAARRTGAGSAPVSVP